MMKIDLGEQLETMIGIAAEASDKVRRWLDEGRALDPENKPSGEPVTALDKAVNEFIHERMAARLDGPVIGEEDEASTQSEAVALGSVFYVDPIDGTQELIRDNGEFAVMIGLAVDGLAEAGVVAMPASGELLAGRVGQRAVLQTADGERRLIGVTAAGRFGDARVLVSRSHRPPRIEALQRRLGVRQLIPCGSAGVKVTRIARGEAELYVHAGRGLASWDCCAPEAILSAAGGRMTDLQGHTLRYLPNRPKMPGGVIASNGVLHPGALSAVPWAIREERRLREHQAEASPAPGEDESGSSR